MFVDAHDAICPGSIDAIYKNIEKMNNPDLILCDIKTNYLTSKNDAQLKIKHYQQLFSAKFFTLLSLILLYWLHFPLVSYSSAIKN